MTAKGKSKNIFLKNNWKEAWYGRKNNTRYKDFKNVDEHKKAHVGYYLIDDGKYELENVLEIKHSSNYSTEFNMRFYIASTIVWPMFFHVCEASYLF